LDLEVWEVKLAEE
jgi:hypothetical protein